MGQVAVRLPDVFDVLPEKEKQAILNVGIKKSIEERIKQLSEEVEIAQRKIRKFEEKYKMPWVSFAQKEPEGWEEHEDYTDWKLWEDVLKENLTLIEKLRSCLEK
ncbi:MAG: hypothetical protein AB1556_03885 [Bacillota bacterium]